MKRLTVFSFIILCALLIHPANTTVQANQCTADAAFVTDVTVPDDTVFAPGERFDNGLPSLLGHPQEDEPIDPEATPAGSPEPSGVISNIAQHVAEGLAEGKRYEVKAKDEAVMFRDRAAWDSGETAKQTDWWKVVRVEGDFLWGRDSDGNEFCVSANGDSEATHLDLRPVKALDDDLGKGQEPVKSEITGLTLPFASGTPIYGIVYVDKNPGPGYLDWLGNTTGYGCRPNFDEHTGTDFYAERGTNVLMAASKGIVIDIVRNHPEDGNTVIVYTENPNFGSLYLAYAHLDNINVNNSQEVKRGDVIGTLGRTGIFPDCDPRHLHFGVSLSAHNWNLMSLDPFTPPRADMWGRKNKTEGPFGIWAQGGNGILYPDGTTLDLSNLEK